MKDLAVSTYTALGRQPLPRVLHSLADAGHERVEILATPPHVNLEHVSSAIAALAPALRETGQQVTSVVPSGVDVNLASTHEGMRRWSQQQFLATLRLAAALEAPRVIVHPGRRHPLRPPPEDQLRAWVLEGLEVILGEAEREGIRVLLENVPTGLIDTARECVDVLATFSGRIGLCYDVANGFMVEDVPRALAEQLVQPELVHLSDTRSSQWLHAPLGSAEVEWVEVASALADRGYAGPTVLETLHDGDPVAGFAHDAVVWEAALLRAAR